MRECTHPRPSLQHHMSHDLIILTWPPVSCLVVQGHSIGGSLATLLMLMYVRRGVLSQESLATVYTFGAPAVFCQGGDGSSFDTLEVGVLRCLCIFLVTALMAAGGLLIPRLMRLGVWQDQQHACSCLSYAAPLKPLTIGRLQWLRKGHSVGRTEAWRLSHHTGVCSWARSMPGLDYIRCRTHALSLEPNIRQHLKR